MLYTIPT